MKQRVDSVPAGAPHHSSGNGNDAASLMGKSHKKKVQSTISTSSSSSSSSSASSSGAGDKQLTKVKRNGGTDVWVLFLQHKDKDAYVDKFDSVPVAAAYCDIKTESHVTRLINKNTAYWVCAPEGGGKRGKGGKNVHKPRYYFFNYDPLAKGTTADVLAAKLTAAEAGKN